MAMIYDLEHIEKPLINPVLTIGNFDGVHRGHLVLFEKVKERARTIHGQSAVMTFDPHPLRVMRPGNDPLLITPLEQKLKLIGDAGIDVIFCVPFTRSFARISAEDFVRRILVDKIGIKEIVVGYDYTFGHLRKGSIELLQRMGSEMGFRLHVLGPVKIEGSLVSSTAIRNLVKEGNLSEVKRLLGRDYQICGTVVRGKNRGGRLLGFPTANLKLVDELIPKGGVYAVRVVVDQEVHQGVTNIGYNPTFGDRALSVETHILDFSGDLLGKTIRINFVERLRDEKTYKSVEELADQIGKDILEARELFQSESPSP
jgi:riboflavin kinase/FMN adenylyltransferase